jgi:hypothetical protein
MHVDVDSMSQRLTLHWRLDEQHSELRIDYVLNCVTAEAHVGESTRPDQNVVAADTGSCPS